jgi:NAD-dependent dihydropyrimidine dehydrogenase PreA subunit
VRADGIFIAIEVDDAAAADADVARRLSEACPVDIFAQGDRAGALEIVPQNVDECVLCRLCLDAVESDPTHPVKVIKLYDDGALLA